MDAAEIEELGKFKVTRKDDVNNESYIYISKKKAVVTTSQRMQLSLKTIASALFHSFLLTSIRGSVICLEIHF